jgi:putative copper export protein
VIDDVELARAVHVLCVAHWIGGVAFVTLVALPRAGAGRRREGLGAL